MAKGMVLVTGGAGYIGSPVCKALAEVGLTPICFDTLEKGHAWAVRWGPLERGDIGQTHDPETHLMPLAVDAALGLGRPLTLLGLDYPTADASCLRDFVHVTDRADAHLRVLGWLDRTSTGGVRETINIGSGSGYSVKQVVAETARLAGRPVPYEVGPRRRGDSPKLVGDIGKARRELGWQPSHNLALQIEDTVRWRRRMPR